MKNHGRACVVVFTAIVLVLACRTSVFAQAPARAIQAEPEGKKPRPVQIAFFQLEAQGVEQRVATIVTEMILTELSKMKEIKVIGSREIDAMLGYEQKKQMAGCTDTSCMVAIGGALGVDKILMGTVGKLGASYTLNLKLINIKEGSVEQNFGKRIKGGSEEDFLDIIPEALAYMFPAAAPPGAKTSPAAPEGGRGAPIEVVDLQRTPGQMKVPAKQQAASQATQTSPPSPTPEVRGEAPLPPSVDRGGDMSHADQFFLGGKGIMLLVPAIASAGEVHLGYGLNKWVEVGAAVVISINIGFKGRATAYVYNPDGAIKPCVGVQVPYYKTNDGAMVGAGVIPGVQWDFHKNAGMNLEVTVDYYFMAPGKMESLQIMGLAGAQVRI